MSCAFTLNTEFIQDLTVVVSAANTALNFCFQLHKLPIFAGQLVLQHHGVGPGPRSSPHECLSSSSRVRAGPCVRARAGLFVSSQDVLSLCQGDATLLPHVVQHHRSEPDGERTQKGIPRKTGTLEHLTGKISRVPGTRLFFE